MSISGGKGRVCWFRIKRRSEGKGVKRGPRTKARGMSDTAITGGTATLTRQAEVKVTSDSSYAMLDLYHG